MDSVSKTSHRPRSIHGDARRVEACGERGKQQIHLGFVFPIFKHCLFNYLRLIFVKSATLDGPVFYLYVEKDARMVCPS